MKSSSWIKTRIWLEARPWTSRTGRLFSQPCPSVSAAVLRGQNSVMTVSTELAGEYGISGVSLSVPAIVSREGVTRVVEGRLAPEEQASLEASAEVLRKASGVQDG
jgi:malate/lactate dehydrogenase